MSEFRRKLLVVNSKPYDTEVEYLENTYRDWINTGVRLTNDMGFKIVFESTTQTGAGFPICGVFQSSGGNLCLRFGAANIFVVYSGTTYVDTKVNKSTTVGNKTTVVVTVEHEVFVNGVKKGSFSRDTQVNESDFLLFRATGNTNFTPLKIYEFSLFTPNETVFDGIPVRLGTTGYMYDKVSRQLFGNSGTGNFILPPGGGGIS